MPPTHAGLADPRAYVRVATIVRQQIIDGTLKPGQAGAIDHPPRPGARARAADLQQGAAHAGKRGLVDPFPRPRLLREPSTCASRLD